MIRRLFIVFILISTFAVAGCKISGTITLTDGTGVGGVTVVLEGEDGDAFISAPVETDADGNYVFEGFHHGMLTITPKKEGYTFNPPSETVPVDLFANAVVDFKATEPQPEPEPEPEKGSEKSQLPWSTYQGNAAHTGYVPVFLNTNEFSYSWTKNIAAIPELDIDSVVLHPAVAGDGKVFITTGSDYGPHVAMALDSSDGRRLWLYNFGYIDSISPPAYSEGTVYIQSGVGTDSFLWVFSDEEADPKEDVYNERYDNQSFRYYAPTIYDDYVYMGGGESGGGFGAGVYGFEGVLGGSFWYVHLGDLNTSDQWTPAVSSDYVITYNGLYDYNLFADSKLTVINRLDNTDVYSIPDPRFKWTGTSLNLAPALGSQDNVIVIQDSRLISFDLLEKDIGWQIPGGEEGDDADEEEMGGKHFSGQPSLANGFIYALYKGYLHARNESDGAFVWEWQPPSGESIVMTPMLVTNNLIFVSTESISSPETKTYAVDLESQSIVWSYPAGGYFALGNDGVLFIATTKGELIAISTVDSTPFATE